MLSIKFTKIEISALLLLILLRFILMIIVPLTGDEAYFISWGRDISWGYYDHPPMIGWVIYLLSFISQEVYFYRFVANLIPLIITGLIYQIIFKLTDKKIAFYTALIYFVSPVSTMSVYLSNDLVLLLFGFIGFYFYVLASQNISYKYAVFSGLFLGLTFLSKYLVGMFFIGILIHNLIFFDKRKFLINLVVVFIISIFVAQNIIYNFQNCWDNILFNFFSRTTQTEFEIQNIGWLFLFLGILIPPPSLYFFAKAKLNKNININPLLLSIVFTSLVIFSLVTIVDIVSLHWLMLYIPFIYMLFSNFTLKQLKVLFYYSLIAGLLISLTIIIFISQFSYFYPKDNTKIFPFITAEICKKLPSNQLIFTFGYSENSMLEYHCPKNEYHVAFTLSKFGREDDKKIDFSQFKAQNMLFFSQYEKDTRYDIHRYFDSVKIKEVVIDEDIKYYLHYAENFDFDLYRKEVIQQVYQKFYTAPSWLVPAQCEFKEKYKF